MFRSVHLKKCTMNNNNYIRSKCRNFSNLKILGIETSCDDTGCAVIDGSGKVLSNVLCSQSLVHLRNGGVNPLIAQELHRDNIEGAVKEALDKSSVPIENIDAIAVTIKPGLLLCLKIGVKYAKYLARQYNKPLVPIHHMEAHALVARMYHEIDFPFLVLLISGGHCQLAVAKDVDEFLLLGECLDNAPGEALDKVARRMKLRNIPEYSSIAGGKAVQLAAEKATNTTRFVFPTPLVRIRDCNFSFSGIKESLYRKLRRKEAEHSVCGDEIIPEVYDLCSSFQTAVVEHLIHRTHRAATFCEDNGIIKENKSLVVSGGVACNNYIFRALQHFGQNIGYKVSRPPPEICTDNGVMIAWNGLEKLKKGFQFTSDFNLNNIDPKAPFGTSLVKKVITQNISVRVTRL